MGKRARPKHKRSINSQTAGNEDLKEHLADTDIQESESQSKEIDDEATRGKNVLDKSCSSQEPIAIVGMTARMPHAQSLGEFWDTLLKSSTLPALPNERFDLSDFGLRNRARADGRDSKTAGNANGDTSLFDSQFFKSSPAEATAMDPQRRLLIETVYESIENAGYSINDIADQIQARAEVSSSRGVSDQTMTGHKDVEAALLGSAPKGRRARKAESRSR